MKKDHGISRANSKAPKIVIDIRKKGNLLGISPQRRGFELEGTMQV